MRFRYLLSVLIVSLAFVTQAQPGYQGKKFLTTYNLRFVPALTNKNFHSKSGVLPGDFNLTHIANIEYVVSRKVSLGMRYSFTRTSVDMNFIDEKSPFNIYKNRDDLAFKAYVHGIGFYTKMFYGGHQNLAPRGSYMTLQADAYYTMVKDSYVNNSTVGNYWGNFSIGIGFGKQMIVFDRLVLDYGIESNLCVPGILGSTIYKMRFDVDDEYDYDDTSAPDKISDLQKIVNGRVFDMYMVMFKLGIGFLAF